MHKSPSMQKTLKKSFAVGEKVTAWMLHMMKKMEHPRSLKKTSSPLTAFDSPKVVQVVRYVVQEELAKRQGGQASEQQSMAQRSVQTVNQNMSILSSRLPVSNQGRRGTSISTTLNSNRRDVGETLSATEHAPNEDWPASLLSWAYIEVWTQ